MGIADDTPQSCWVVLSTLPIFESSDNSQSVACRRRHRTSFLEERRSVTEQLVVDIAHQSLPIALKLKNKQFNQDKGIVAV
ncbi:hypothetical protein [Nostoc sp.]|uniref:hypothetical protein n=1 Tax=Nostoc sp. TaxID=1180 RepID=UPI002FFA7E20